MSETHNPNPETEIGHVLNAAEALAKRLVDADQRADTAEHMLNIDAKSGLSTETKWRADLAETINELEEGQSVLVLVGDLNGFKAVNDTLGHAAGDELLGVIGQAFHQSFRRENDFVARGNRDIDSESLRSSIARLGGDEFSVFTVTNQQDDHENPHRNTSDPEQAIKLHSDRINLAISELTRGTKYEEFNVRIAIGGAVYDPEVDTTPEDVFIRADAKMYEQKYSGKIAQITPEDRQNLLKIIPYMEGLGARVEDWLKDAVYMPQT